MHIYKPEAYVTQSTGKEGREGSGVVVYTNSARNEENGWNIRYYTQF